MENTTSIPSRRISYSFQWMKRLAREDGLLNSLRASPPRFTRARPLGCLVLVSDAKDAGGEFTRDNRILAAHIEPFTYLSNQPTNRSSRSL